MLTRLLKAPRIDFSSLRRELELPTQFPLAAQREADASAAAVAATLNPGADRVDHTDIAFVTIDPATSRDLDQAMCLQRREDGYRVYYAIADVTAFVPAGGELEAETWRRGETVYLPDGNVPLHPVSLSEGAASLLPDQVRAAVLWTIDINVDGSISTVEVNRAVVRSRAKLDYVGVQADVTAGTLHDSIALLPEIGRVLIQRGLARGAVDLPIPEQEVEPDGADGWRLVLRTQLPAEQWNAQISLLTGMAAARLMLEAKVGLLRTMPAPHPDAVARLRAAAPGLGIGWPDGASLGAVVASVDPSTPRGAAFVDQAAETIRGAGYTAFDGQVPAEHEHGGVAAAYAHVTAPLRRLADRYATEVCLAVAAATGVPDWVRTALPKLPETMERSGHRASSANHGAVDLAEAVLLADRIGEEFSAAVLDTDEPRHHNGAPVKPGGTVAKPRGTVALDEPPVRARCVGSLALGQRIRVRLTVADPQRRMVEFEAL